MHLQGRGSSAAVPGAEGRLHETCDDPRGKDGEAERGPARVAPLALELATLGVDQVMGEISLWLMMVDPSWWMNLNG